MVLKAASATDECDFEVEGIHASIPSLSLDEVAKICRQLADPSIRALRCRYEGDDEIYEFYSVLLRNAVSTFVLESQRTNIRNSLGAMYLGYDDRTSSNCSSVGSARHRRRSSMLSMSSFGSERSAG